MLVGVHVNENTVVSALPNALKCWSLNEEQLVNALRLLIWWRLLQFNFYAFTIFQISEIKIRRRVNIAYEDKITQFASHGNTIITVTSRTGRRHNVVSELLTLWRLAGAHEIIEEKCFTITGHQCQHLFMDSKFVVFLCANGQREYEISLWCPNDLHLIRSKRCGGRRLVRPLFYYANGWIALASADKSIQ